MSQPVTKYIVNRRSMQSNNNDPRLRALYKVMQESRQIADAAEADYLFYNEAKCCTNELFKWMRLSGPALNLTGHPHVSRITHHALCAARSISALSRICARSVSISRGTR